MKGLITLDSSGEISLFSHFVPLWGLCGDWARSCLSPRHFASPTPCPALFLGDSLQLQTLRAAHIKGEGRDKSPKLAQWCPHCYLRPSGATTAIQRALLMFCACSPIDQQKSSHAVSGPAFLDQLFCPDYFPELETHSSHSRVLSTVNSMRVKDLANRFDFLSPSKYLLWTVFIRQLVLVAAHNGLLSIAQLVVEKISSLHIFWEGIILNTLCCLNVCLKSQTVSLKNVLHFKVRLWVIWEDENNLSVSFLKAPSRASIVRNSF